MHLEGPASRALFFFKTPHFNDLSCPQGFLKNALPIRGNKGSVRRNATIFHPEVFVNFNELGLKQSSLQALEKMGFTSPSEIQEKAIPALLKEDIDFIGQAQTGTGKTAAFLLPLFEKLDPKQQTVQCLILAPTRELANQIEAEIAKFSAFEKVRSLSVYGGTPIVPQLRALRQNAPSIVVGTPGRVIDLIDRGALKLSEVRFVILDEADEMLDMGFFDDVQRIVSEAPNKKIWMFSATMPAPIKELVARHFNNPLTVKVTKQQLTTEAVEQTYLVAPGREMVEALCRYLDAQEDIYGLVFTRTKIGAQQLADSLNGRGYSTESLHGDMEQEARDFTMKRFKDKKCRLLTCTDVAARGIDVNDLTHVINFELPNDYDSYVHRIGRTGRGGSKGIAVSIVSPMEQRKIMSIERLTKAPIKRVELPDVATIRARLMNKAIKRLETQAAELNVEINPEFAEFSASAEKMEKTDLLKALYGMTLANTMQKYRKANELGVPSRGQPARQGNFAGGNSAGADGRRRYFLNIGEMDGVTPGDLIKFLSREAGMRGTDLGRIDIREKFSFVESTDMIMRAKGVSWGQRRLDVEEAQGMPPMGGGAPAPRRNFPPRGERNDGPRRDYAPRSADSAGAPAPARREYAPRTFDATAGAPAPGRRDYAPRTDRSDAPRGNFAPRGADRAEGSRGDRFRSGDRPKPAGKFGGPRPYNSAP